MSNDKDLTMPHNKEEIINNYINAYNTFDIDGMCSFLDPAIEFINIANGEINLTLNGIDAFKQQAKEAAQLFKERNQKILTVFYGDNHVEVEINYFGIVANDLPNGLTAGSNIELKGKSVFQFHDGMITKLVDMT